MSEFFYAYYPPLEDGSSYDINLTVNSFFEVPLAYVDLYQIGGEGKQLSILDDIAPIEDSFSLAVMLFNTDATGIFKKPLSYNEILFRHVIKSISPVKYMHLEDVMDNVLTLPSDQHANLRKKLLSEPSLF